MWQGINYLSRGISSPVARPIAEAANPPLKPLSTSHVYVEDSEGSSPMCRLAHHPLRHLRELTIVL